MARALLLLTALLLAWWLAGSAVPDGWGLPLVVLLAVIERIAIENPISIISSRIRKPDQIIQPWQYGHGETKATCLWLKGLPKLTPTTIVEGREARVHRMPPGPDRWKERSRTFEGVAAAMAAQWGQAPNAELLADDPKRRPQVPVQRRDDDASRERDRERERERGRDRAREEYEARQAELLRRKEALRQRYQGTPEGGKG